MCKRLVMTTTLMCLMFAGIDQHLRAQVLDLTSVKQQVIAGIKNDYAAMGTVVATMERRFVDPSVTERTEERFEGANGSVATAVREPLRVDASIVTLRGSDLRSDPLGNLDGTVWTHVNGLRTQYVVNLDTAWVRKRSQMPGMFPIDPRDVGSTEVRETLERQLNDSDLKSAKMVNDRLHLLWEFSPGRRAGTQYRCQVDPRRNFRWSRIQFRRTSWSQLHDQLFCDLVRSLSCRIMAD